MGTCREGTESVRDCRRQHRQLRVSHRYFDAQDRGQRRRYGPRDPQRARDERVQ